MDTFNHSNFVRTKVFQTSGQYEVLGIHSDEEKTVTTAGSVTDSRRKARRSSSANLFHPVNRRALAMDKS